MVWLAPGALVLAALAAVPVLIHLLLRRRARKVPFPTVRFIASSDEAAVRVRRPSDLWLLLLRVAIVALAALAVARPLILTDARRDAWGSRTIRAIVVDSSPSVDGQQAIEAATAEEQGAGSARRIVAQDVGAGLSHAAAWLGDAPPGRREIVVVSDFQRGALESPSLSNVPTAVGIRLVRVHSVSVERSFDAPPVLTAGGSAARMVTADDTATAVALAPASAGSGLHIDAPPALADRIVRTVAAAGAVAPSASEPLSIRFGTAQGGGTTTALPQPWMRATARRLFAWAAREGIAGLQATADADALVVRMPVSPDSFAAVQVTQAALNARVDPAALREREPARVPDETLRAWTRAPGPPDADAWRRTSESDGRWLWLAVLALLGIEGRLRRERAAHEAAVEAHAA